MGKVLNGFTPNTAKNLQLDAGILVKNMTDIENFDGTIPEENKIGATSGGGSFGAVPTIRNIFEDLDGARGNYKDGNVIDTWDITLTATLKEITVENLQMALGASDTTPATTNKFDVTTARLEVKTTDYLDNVCWLGTMNGSDDPIIIELKNAMNTNGMTLSYTDKGTGGIELELKAHFDLNNADIVPFTIYTPKVV